MSEAREQKQILEAIDRILAGETPQAAADEEMNRLLAIAGELIDGRPMPSPKYEVQLKNKLRERQEHTGSTLSGITGKTGAKRRWLPGWVTVPRAAAVAAVLIIGLGAIGLTGVLIRERGPESSPGAGFAPQSGRPSADLASGGRNDAAEQSAGGPSPPANLTTQLPEIQRVIQTADYDIEVPRGEFQNQFDMVASLAGKYGGYVVSSNARKTGENEPISGSITVRIANAGNNFASAQGELDELGIVFSKKISGQDVTEEFVDLESRLRNAQAQEAQLIALLQRAETVEEILMIQSRLADVQSQIEQMQGRIKYLESRTDFVTITVNLREENGDFGLNEGKTSWGFVDALKYAGWLAVQTINFVIMALGVAIPAGLIALLLFLLAYRVWQKRRS